MRLIHISDPHLTYLDEVSKSDLRGKRRLGYFSWRRRRRSLHLRSHLDELCAAVRDAAPDQICVTGDLVHIGLPKEIEAAAQWLATLGSPDEVFLVPGNHDVYRSDSWEAIMRGWGPYLRLQPGHAGEPEYWSSFPTKRSLHGVELMGVNTGLPTSLIAATGAIGPRQLERLNAGLLRLPRGTLRIIAMHHPPGQGMIKRRKALTDATTFRATVAKAHLVLHGHGHQNQTRAIGQTRVFGTGSASVADASFRVFDLTRIGIAWEISMVLKRRTPQGFVEIEASRYTVEG